ncbi:MAG: SAM-dependent methyltransferase [Proteobacteria bacterium]|nr:MAG: SAM-dependent methyltransferase [Pseudomonadota bacterium]PIE67344.1 MAG: SAM-dependent methyltransferase [Deltaproteobacteria bacterium]
MNEHEFSPHFYRQADMLANRVKKKFKHLRKRFARQHIEVFRLYDWDIPEIRAVVDWYGGHLVIGEYMRRQSVPEWLPMMARAVAEALSVPQSKVHLKARRAGHLDGKRYERIDYTDKKIILRERDLRFLVNPYDYVDTGLFSDHRNTRELIRTMASGKTFLNLYCYTASFSCYAAKGGARSTTSVDRSENTLLWARENFSINGIDMDTNRLVHAHTFDFLKRARDKGLHFDLAVVDPPSYSTTKTRDLFFDIVRDHPRLLSEVICLMKPGATLFFSTNHQGFEPHLDGLNVSTAIEITDRTIPEDYAHKRKTIHRCWRITV